MCNFLSAILTKDYEVFCQASLSSNSHESIVKANNLSDLKIGGERDWLRVEFVPNGSIEGNVQDIKWKYELDGLASLETLPFWYNEKTAEKVVTFFASIKLKELLKVEDIGKLQGANFEGADLGRVNFERANLQGANFIGVNLGWASFRGANLGGVDFEGANLGGVDFEGADLEGADFEGANLWGAKS